jgi:tetratricopeptide (TPR) repeat protein
MLETMGKQYRREMPAGAKDSVGNIIFAGIICLAAGVGIGYYFGKSVGSSSLPVSAPASSQAQPPVMDPATFLQNEASLKSILSSNPRDLDALVRLGNLYYDNTKYRDAIEYYGKALEIDPNSVDVRTDRGSCYWSLGQADAAIGEFQKSLQVNPSHGQTLYNLGIVYLHGKNDMEGARKAWQKLLATNPEFPDRSRIQEMLTSLASSDANSAISPTGSEPTGQSKTGSSSMEELFRRMKK